VAGDDNAVDDAASDHSIMAPDSAVLADADASTRSETDDGQAEASASSDALGNDVATVDGPSADAADSFDSAGPDASPEIGVGPDVTGPDVISEGSNPGADGAEMEGGPTDSTAPDGSDGASLDAPSDASPPLEAGTFDAGLPGTGGSYRLCGSPTLGAPRSLVMSRGSDLLAVGNGAGIIKLYRASDLSSVRTIFAHTDAVNGVSFSSDSSLIASTSQDATVAIWSVATGALIRRLAHPGPGLTVGLEPDGSHVVSGSSDGWVRRWRVGDGVQVASASGLYVTVLAMSPDGATFTDGRGVYHTSALSPAGIGFGCGTPHSAAYSPDGSKVAVGAEAGPVCLANANDGSPLATLTGHTSAVTSVAFSPDQTKVASSSADRTVRSWRLSDQLELPSFAATDTFNGVAYSFDGSELLATTGSLLDAWNLSSGNLIGTRGFDSALTVPLKSVALSGDGKKLAVEGTVNGVLTVELFSADSVGTELFTLANESHPALSSNGGLLAAVPTTVAQQIDVLDTVVGTTQHVATGNVCEVAFSPADPNYLAYWGNVGSSHLTLFNWSSGSEVWSASATGACDYAHEMAISSDGVEVALGGELYHGASIYRDLQGNFPAFSPDGDSFALTLGQWDLDIWSRFDGSLRRHLGGHIVDDTALSADDSVLFTVGYTTPGISAPPLPSTLNQWRVSDSSLLASTRLRGVPTNSPILDKFAPNGALLAHGVRDEVDVWDTTVPSFVSTAHVGSVIRALAVSSDDTQVITGSDDFVVRIWNAKDGSIIKNLTGHANAISAVAISNDGARIASTDGGGTLRIWNTSDGSSRSLSGTGPLTFSPDGALLANAVGKIWRTNDGTVVVPSLPAPASSAPSVAFSPDGSLLLVGGGIFRVSDWTQVSSLDPLLGLAHISQDGRFILGAEGMTLTSYVGLTGAGGAKILRAADTSTVGLYQSFARNIAFSGDGSLLAAWSHLDGLLRLWRVNDGTLVERDPMPGDYAGADFAHDLSVVAVPNGPNVNVYCR
jgi:WD40 repeat protein